MKYFFLGDVYGKIGRKAVKELLPKYLSKYSPDLVFANSENLTHGKGAIAKHLDEMQSCGVDFFTGGNHSTSTKGALEELENSDRQIRPANLPSILPGVGFRLIKEDTLLVSVLGNVFMHQNVACPFLTIDNILKENSAKNVIIDFHGEASSEKKAFAFYVDGRASMVLGTHTHVQTNDPQILKAGTGYITDVGMTGSFDSVIGVNKEIIIQGFRTQLAQKFEPEEEGRKEFSAVYFETNDEGKCIKIENIREVV